MALFLGFVVYQKSGVTIRQGDCRTELQELPDGSVNCCVTSPPYWGLRDYGCDGQLGLESSPEDYVAKLVGVFREVRRVLADDGTLWLNLGDSYCSTATPSGMKPKDLVGIPWLVAIALRADGWYLRQDIIWSKPTAMPESVQDRCVKSHEYLFLLSKSQRYFYDLDSVKIPVAPDTDARYDRGRSDSHKWSDGGPGNQTIAKSMEHMRRSGNKERKPAVARGVPTDSQSVSGNVAGSVPWEGSTANRRTVWSVNVVPFKGAHFATFPPALIEPCILAGCPEGGLVLDPFIGSGTTAQVAKYNGRRCIGIELNPEYIGFIRKRLQQETFL